MKRKIELTVCVILALTIKFSNAVDYCHIKSCNNRAHTACIFRTSGPSTHCTGLHSSGLSSSEKQKIVNLHNKLRQKVANGQELRGSPGPQPPAKSMPNLAWDNELALIAQRWADQCTWGHDSCRNVDRFPVGQNIAAIGTTASINTINVESMVQMWYDEVKDFNRSQVKRFTNDGANGKAVGHYTQLVWAKTTKIGCGAVKYKKGQFNQFYLVCNYGPTGNWIGEPLYQTR